MLMGRQARWKRCMKSSVRGERVKRRRDERHAAENMIWGIQSLEEINSDIRLRSERIMARLSHVEVNDKDLDLLNDKEEEEEEDRLRLSHLRSKLHVFSVLRST